MKMLARYLSWLARYQVKREGFPVIAASAGRVVRNGREVPVTTNHVYVMVKRMERLVEMRITPIGRRGRPIGSKTRNRQNRVTRRR